MIVSDTDESVGKCICPQCPSFPKDCREETLYCARGKSSCEIEVIGCTCSSCPIYMEYQLKGLYFCDKEEVSPAGTYVRKRRLDEDVSRYLQMVNIRQVAATGKSIVCSMGSQKRLPFSLDDLHFVPAQVYRIPLEREDRVRTEVIIGPQARKPLRVSSPVMISGMSLGATSKNVKLVISQVAAMQHVAYCSGEGGIMEEEFTAAPSLIIGQYTTYNSNVDMEVLKKVAAVEIRFGQGAYPGLSSILPESKLSSDLTQIPGINGVEQAYSPAHHIDMRTPKEVGAKISWLREATGGVPVGAKIGCGNIEKDVEILVEAGVDFIALDGFGGATGGTELYARENVGVPIIAALPRASRLIGQLGCRDSITLIAGGGLRTSGDFTKCLAIGADAVYIATAALIAMNCEQYRVCHTGHCPTGVTTHNRVLARQLDLRQGIEKLSNFIRVSTDEIASLTRIVGKDDIKELDREDLVSMDKELAKITGTRWLNGS